MGQLLLEGSDFAHVDHRLANPATGPIYIEEACPGDMVLVEILDIDLDQVGILDKGPTGGALKGHFPEYVIRRLCTGPVHGFPGGNHNPPVRQFHKGPRKIR